MVQATAFFDRPARGMCSIYSQVFSIFTDNFKTFAILAILQSLAYIPVFIIFFFLAVAILATELMVMAPALGNGVRRLVGAEESTWFEATKAPYVPPTDYDPFAQEPDESEWGTANDPFASSGFGGDGSMIPPGFGTFMVSVFFLYVAFLAAIICVSASFQGAFIRAASEVYAGRSPNWQTCLQIGRKKMCSIICFGWLLLLCMAVGGVVWLGLMMLAANTQSFGLGIVSHIGFMVFLFVFSSGMAAGLPAVMVENKSTMAAMGRSWKLCAGSLCFIFWCIFCFYVLEMIGQHIVTRMLVLLINTSSTNPAAVGGVVVFASWLMTLLLGPLNATLNPVIYFSLRIQKEGLTMEELEGDLALLEDSIELRTGNGVYGKVHLQGKGNDLTPIAHGTIV